MIQSFFLDQTGGLRPAAALNIAKEMGYEFSPEEARQASEQLTPEQLENLAAGVSYRYIVRSISLPPDE